VLIVVTDPHATLRENVCARLRPECQISRHSAPGSTQHPAGPCGSGCGPSRRRGGCAAMVREMHQQLSV